MVFLLACVIIIDFYLEHHSPQPLRERRLFQKKLILFVEVHSRKQLSLSGGYALWSPLFRQRKSYPAYRSQIFRRVLLLDVTSDLMKDHA